MERRALFLLAQGTSCLTFVLLIAGGLVTSTDSGLAVPDWPLSYGGFFPPMVGGIRFEHTHRVIAFFVALLTFFLAVGCTRSRLTRSVKVLAAVCFLTVFLQALLGGLTVLTRLPAPVSIAHACLGQTFFILTVALSVMLSPFWEREPLGDNGEWGTLKKGLMGLAGFAYLQLILGAMARHTQAGWAVGLHVVNAFAVLALTTVVALNAWTSLRTLRNLFWVANAIVFFMGAQIILGMGALIHTTTSKGTSARTAEVIWTTAHQATGALILGATTLLTLMVFRLLRNGTSSLKTQSSSLKTGHSPKLS